MTTTDEARVTDEETAEYVQFCRGLGAEQLTIAARAVLSLADRLAARDAELAEMVALLDTEPQRDAAWESKRRALLAKLRTP